MKQYIKLSEYARKKSICYKTAWNHFKSDKLKNAIQDDFGNILVEDDVDINNSKRAIVYARVSNNNRKESLKQQQKFLEQYCSQKDYTIVHSCREIGSGMNDSRKQLLKILDRDDWNIIVVENKDRLTRFGFNYIQSLLNKQNKKIEIVNVTDDDKQDLMSDLISIIYSFSARLYGKRKAKRKENIKTFLENQ